jgi:phage shock protein C
MQKKLYRSRTDRMIAGVCGGIAEYFNIDATLVRIIAFVLLLPGGLPGLLPYAILWFIVPEKPAGD